jgi:uncharacterized protein with PQ loop repeat
MLHQVEQAAMMTGMPMAALGPGAQGREVHLRADLAGRGVGASALRRAHSRLSGFVAQHRTQDALESDYASLPRRVHAMLDDLGDNYYIYRKPHIMFNVLGVMAGIISLVAIFPQILIIIERQSACDLSETFLVGTLVVQCIWVLYSFGNRLYLNGCFAAFTAAVVLWMVVLKHKYDSPLKCAREREAALACDHMS